MKYFTPLQPEKYYHIFNHAVGDDNFYKTHENYLYFLRRFKNYIHPIAKTYAFVLMPNHFHFLIEIRDENTIYNRYLELQKDNEELIEKLNFKFEKFIMQQFSNFFNSYTKSFNKMFSRRGALFIDYLRRVHINNNNYFLNCIQYIHQNPIHHNFCDKIDKWKYSSFHSILSNKNTNVEREIVLESFAGIENFVAVHKSLKNFEY